MKDVTEKDGIDGSCGEARIRGGSQDCRERRGGVLGGDVEELLVDVYGEDFAGVAGEAAGEVAGAGADVGDGLFGLEGEGGDDLVRLLPGIAGRTVENAGVLGRVAGRMVLMLNLRQCERSEEKEDLRMQAHCFSYRKQNR